MTQCGYRSGLDLDHGRQNWDGTGPRPLSWRAWYPCPDTPMAPSSDAFFDPGSVATGAQLDGATPLPVVLISHGTGGSADSLGWIARALVSRGHVVIGVNHHGNTGSDVRAEGFLCWWERATDLSVLLSHLSETGPFAGHLDLQNVTAIGFSLGSHTALCLAGARTSLKRFERWRSSEAPGMSGPREFPDLVQAIPGLLDANPVFRTSWDQHGADFSDPRIGRVIALAPPPPVQGFTAASLRNVSLPVLLVTCQNDTEAPTTHGADWLTTCNPGFVHCDIGTDAGHYSFLDLPADPDLLQRDEIFLEADGVNRRDIHQRILRLILGAMG